MGDGESKGRPHQGPTQELLRSDKAIVNQAAEQTIREGGRREEVGGAREATNLITMGLVTITFCPLNNLGLPSCSSSLRESKTVGEKGFLSGGKRLIFNYETRLPRADTLSHTSSLLQTHHRPPERHDAPLMRGVNFPMHGFFGDTAEPSPKACLTLGQQWKHPSLI